MNKKITVIDSVMGTGKTTYMIQRMKEQPEKQFLYVTPLLTECERVAREVPHIESISEEDSKYYKGKSRATKYLLQQGKSLAITHSCFELLTQETVKIIEARGVSLVIDETVSSTRPINLSSVEMMLLRDNHAIEETVCDNGAILVKWKNFSILEDTRFIELYESFFDNNKEVYLTPNDTHIVTWLLPAGVYHAAKEVTLMTYNFRKTEMEAYFNFHNIPYSVHHLSSGSLVEGDPPICGKQFKDKIHILNHKINDIGKRNHRHRSDPLSKNWYLRASPKQLANLSNNCYNFFQNILRSSSKDNMWTVFEVSEFVDYVEDAYGARWKKERITDEGVVKKKSRKVKEKIEKRPFKSVGRIKKGLSEDSEEYKRQQCWVPCNSRGTNIYSDRKNLAYLNCMHISPSLINFFKAFDIEISNDTFALNLMIQWIWRSAIRNGEEIHLYVPSERMRHLLMDWLGYSESEKF